MHQANSLTTKVTPYYRLNWNPKLEEIYKITKLALQEPQENFTITNETPQASRKRYKQQGNSSRTMETIQTPREFLKLARALHRLAPQLKKRKKRKKEKKKKKGHMTPDTSHLTHDTWNITP